MLIKVNIAITSLIEVNIKASIYLLLLKVVVYIYFSRLRATFLTNYIYGFIIIVIIV